jgi:hypothetical protein
VVTLGLATIVALVVALGPGPLGAQRIRSAEDDAITLTRGTLRVGISGELTLQRDRWQDGRLEGLGGNLTGDVFGPTQFSLLSPLQSLVRGLGVSDFAASLGAPRLDVRQRVFVTPLAIEYGVTDWLTLGVRAPLVRTSAESQFRIRGDSGRATLGPNPLFYGTGVAATNSTAIGRFSTASASLGALRDACVADPAAAPECPTVLAELAAVDALMSGASTFASGLTTLYGAGTIGGQRYVPVAGSPAEAVLLARIDSIRVALERYGITDVPAGAELPLGAQTPMSGEDLNRLVTDSLVGFGARPLREASLNAIGDVDISAKVRLFDSFDRAGRSRFTAGGFGLRQSLLVRFRLGTGTRERADEFLDQGSGTGTNAISLRSLTDVMLGDRFWTTMSLGYTASARSDVRIRVPSVAGAQWLESWREALVPVTPGALMEVAFAPRWQLSDYVALGAEWRWRGKGADRYAIDSTATTPLGTTVPLLGSILGDASRTSEQKAGLTATFSTLAARARGHDGLALEFSYTHLQSIGSATGAVPKQWQDRVQVRYYTRFLGR